jgi:hypothetical protein
MAVVIVNTFIGIDKRWKGRGKREREKKRQRELYSLGFKRRRLPERVN